MKGFKENLTEIIKHRLNSNKFLLVCSKYSTNYFKISDIDE